MLTMIALNYHCVREALQAVIIWHCHVTLTAGAHYVIGLLIIHQRIMSAECYS